ncbi:hypothetical protein VPHK469_0168 [Vibrio phage K469]
MKTYTYEQTLVHLDKIITNDPHTVKEFWKSGFNPLNRDLNTQSHALKAIRKLLGNPPPRTQLYNFGQPTAFCGVADRAKDVLFPKACEVSFSMFYPTIIGNLYGEVEVNGFKVKHILTALGVLRLGYKRKSHEGEKDRGLAGGAIRCKQFSDYSGKAKALMCGFYGVLAECEVAGMTNANIEVPVAGRRYLNKLFEDLVTGGYTPVYADTDSLFITGHTDETLEQLLQQYEATTGIRPVTENVCNLIINRVKRYMHTGVANTTIQGYRIFQHKTMIGRRDNRRELDVREKVIEDLRKQFSDVENM